MVIPAIIIFVALLVWPLLQGIFYTFTNYQGYGDWRFVGLDNYKFLFQDDVIWGSYGFTFLFAISSTLATNVIAMVLALLLNSAIKAKNLFRGIFFLPYMLPVLIVSYIFSYLFTNNIPLIGQWLGWEWLSSSLLANEDLAWLAIVFVGVWQGVAFTTLIYISGLQTVPEEVYEAASLDGANKWKQFWTITFPLIMPFFTINVELQELPWRIRPGRRPHRGRSRHRHPIHLVLDLQERFPGRRVRLPDGERRHLLHHPHRAVVCPAAIPPVEGGQLT